MAQAEAFFSTLSWQEKRTEVAKNAETFFFFFLSFFLFFTTRPWLTQPTGNDRPKKGQTKKQRRQENPRRTAAAARRMAAARRIFVEQHPIQRNQPRPTDLVTPDYSSSKMQMTSRRLESATRWIGRLSDEPSRRREKPSRRREESGELNRRRTDRQVDAGSKRLLTATGEIEKKSIYTNESWQRKNDDFVRRGNIYHVINIICIYLRVNDSNIYIYIYM
jgi:hypothetical protein